MLRGPENEGPVTRPSTASNLLEVPGRFIHIPVASRLITQENSTAPPGRAAAFLDRDGVVIDESGYLVDPRDIQLMPGAAEAISALSEFFLIVIVTNQSAVARGLTDEDGLARIHGEMVRQLAESGGVIDAIYYCPHLPDGNVEAFSVTCECRKPAPGMVLTASRDWNLDLSTSFLIGDQPRDIEAGEAAGVTAHKVGSGSTYPGLKSLSDHLITDLSVG
jgi:D-glycero-D-manno-heptose 1,7-bisphosphate phosphatase